MDAATGREELGGGGGAVNLDAVMQKIAEHKGCGTHGGSGKASCGSGAGAGRSADRDLGKGQEPSLLQRRSASSLCAHACRGRAGLQHPVQLLQPQIRLRQRIAPRRGQRKADPGAGREEGSRRRLHDSADDGAGHRRPGRSARQPGEDLQDLRADRARPRPTSSSACRPTA